MTTNADLMTRRNAAVVRGIGHTTPLSASRALNAELWDVEGKRYVDFAGGIAVLNTGHCHPQDHGGGPRADGALHPYLLPGGDVRALYRAGRAPQRARADLRGRQVRLFTTGAEATENAIKIARAATGRSGVIAFTGGVPWPHDPGASGTDGKGRPVQEGPRSGAAGCLACPVPGAADTT